MNNHFHLAIEGAAAEISAYIGGVSSSYSKYWQRSHKSGYGPIWQGRFKSIIVPKELYQNQLGRYIELNPLRAQITGISMSRAAEYAEIILSISVCRLLNYWHQFIINGTNFLSIRELIQEACNCSILIF